jgi:hypothetical protein
LHALNYYCYYKILKNGVLGTWLKWQNVCLSSKHETLSSNTSNAKKKEN